jgi:3-deoxy-D-manno-octulosonic-acid transferase
MIWRILYNSLFIPLGWLGFRVFGLLNGKARRGIEGRRGLFEQVEAKVSGWKAGSPRVWIHASSMGEFEQAKPIISMLKERRPDVLIAATFFSPSGYEHSRKYREADLISYIPFDSPWNARRFVGALNPTVAVVMRYDLWPNHVHALRDAGIPAILANATIRAGGVRNMPVFRGYYRELYDQLTAILTVTGRDREACLGYGVTRPNVEAVGDTRYDQVARRCEESRKKRLVPEEVLRGKTVIVIGSSWEADERLLLPAFEEYCAERPDILVILVPHEPTEDHLAELEARIEGRLSSIRFSQLVSYNGERVVIVDSVGILVSLYQYAHLVYVGGGFGAGVHNVLEPAVYGVPVMIGPNHRNSNEAMELIARDAVVTVDGDAAVRDALRPLFSDPGLRDRMGKTALSFVNERRGATARIVAYLEKLL